MDKQKIGVLTSGGDAPGMNAAIASIVKEAKPREIEVIGFKNGYRGLMENENKPLTLKEVDGITKYGGTILKSYRTDEFKTEQGLNEGVETVKKENLQGLIIIGGEGTIKGGRKLTEKGVKVIAIPCSIDNDVAGTDYSIGFHTACNIVVDILDRIKDTALSLYGDAPRIFLVETMGRNKGWISLISGLSGEADLILIPEKTLKFNKIIEKIKKILEEKRYCIIVMAEGYDPEREIADKIENSIGYRVRNMIVGFAQRGGTPCVFDRMLALKMGKEAVKNLVEGENSRLIAIRGNKIVSVKINQKSSYRTTTADYLKYL